jgi:translation initiation factor IF-2
MSHKSHHHHAEPARQAGPARPSEQIPAKPPTLSLVVKGDTDGSDEAVCASLLANTVPGTALEILHKGVGDICKNDVLTAASGSRLVVGFNVGVHPGIEQYCREQGVEIRLYSIIYRLQEDFLAIARSLLPRQEEEQILGSARVIALFKSSRKGVILGCQIETGRLQVGDRFRVIAAMGPVYTGKIESLHIERNTVSKAAAGQQVGLKMSDFKGAKIGDQVEAFRPLPPSAHDKWEPSGKILRF